MSTTLILDKLDATVDSVDGTTVIDFKEIPKTAQRPTAQQPMTRRWWLIGGLVGASIALATAATVVANVIAKRPTGPRQFFGVRPVRRYGMRHVATPRGGTAWLAYSYRLPDLRVRLPEMTLPKVTLPKIAISTVRGHHK
jgi:hypothetical protein